MSRVVLVLAALALAVLAACGGSGDGDGDDYTVLAAASLTEAFQRIGESTCCASFSFGPSSAIVRQVVEGAPADVVATADAGTMTAIAEAGVLDGEPVEIATNSVVLVVPAGNPAGISGLADLGDGGKLAVCAAAVPCGKGAARWLGEVGLTVEPATFESDVKAVITKVTLGEVDAGIVYRTDALAAGTAVEVTDAAPGIANSYFIALVEGASSGARDFVAAVTGDDGRRVLAEVGFTLP